MYQCFSSQYFYKLATTLDFIELSVYHYIYLQSQKNNLTTRGRSRGLFNFGKSTAQIIKEDTGVKFK